MASAFSGCSFGDNFTGSTNHTVTEGWKTPVSPCELLCGDLSPKAECADFRRESKRGAFVDDCAKIVFCRVIPIDGNRKEACNGV